MGQMEDRRHTEHGKGKQEKYKEIDAYIHNQIRIHGNTVSSQWKKEIEMEMRL